MVVYRRRRAKSLAGNTCGEASGTMTRSNSSPFANLSGSTTTPPSGRLSRSPSTTAASPSTFATRRASLL